MCLHFVFTLVVFYHRGPICMKQLTLCFWNNHCSYALHYIMEILDKAGWIIIVWFLFCTSIGCIVLWELGCCKDALRGLFYKKIWNSAGILHQGTDQGPGRALLCGECYPSTLCAIIWLKYRVGYCLTWIHFSRLAGSGYDCRSNIMILWLQSKWVFLDSAPILYFYASSS